MTVIVDRVSSTKLVGPGALVSTGNLLSACNV